MPTSSFANLVSILGNATKLDEVAPIVQELLRRKPEYNCSYAMDDFLIEGRSFRSKQYIEQYVAGLRKAGLPE